MKLFTENRVIILATSPKTRGGITSVIKAHKKGVAWNKFNVVWIPTHIDKSSFHKLSILLIALFKFIYYLPSAKIIHAHLSLVNSAKRKSLFINIAKIFSKKIIIHFHPPGHNPEYLKKNLRSFYTKLFLKADRIVVLSPYWKKWVQDEIHIEKNIEVIFNPCPTTNPVKHIKENIILFAGSIIDRKGYKDLIIAFSKISRKYKSWKLILAGNGEIEVGKQLAKEYDIDSKVIFTGWIKGSDKTKLFNSSSIFCLPSYGEGFPMAILDAWSHGLPVISTTVGGLSDILKNEENSLTFEPGNIEELAKKLDQLISNQNLRIKISENSLSLASNEFNIHTINAKIDELYTELSQADN